MDDERSHKGLNLEALYCYFVVCGNKSTGLSPG